MCGKTNMQSSMLQECDEKKGCFANDGGLCMILAYQSSNLGN